MNSLVENTGIRGRMKVCKNVFWVLWLEISPYVGLQQSCKMHLATVSSLMKVFNAVLPILMHFPHYFFFFISFQKSTKSNYRYYQHHKTGARHWQVSTLFSMLNHSITVIFSFCNIFANGIFHMNYNCIMPKYVVDIFFL